MALDSLGSVKAGNDEQGFKVRVLRLLPFRGAQERDVTEAFSLFKANPETTVFSLQQWDKAVVSPDATEATEKIYPEVYQRQQLVDRFI